MEVTVLIPNYNGLKFLYDCIDCLKKQSTKDFRILVVDNASSDKSVEWLKENNIDTLVLDKNYGFAGGVNAGIKEVDTAYTILLNNDTKADIYYVENLLKSIKAGKKIFSVSPLMIQAQDNSLVDDAGDGLCIIGFAYQIGVGETVKRYNKKKKVFAACAGAAIYDTALLKEFGAFDEAHFAYLEDVDLGYRARLYGYDNLYEPSARVIHIGSATSGSKYNDFKVKLAARNNIYLHYKNQPLPQLIINALPIAIGMFIKLLFFAKKGFAKAYTEGIKEGFASYKRCKRVDFKKVKLSTLIIIEFELIINMFKFVLHFIKRRIDRLR